jgi:hypothetical protein
VFNLPRARKYKEGMENDRQPALPWIDLGVPIEEISWTTHSDRTKIVAPCREQTVCVGAVAFLKPHLEIAVKLRQQINNSAG